MINPFRWHAILETADFYQTAEIDTRSGEIVSDPHQDVLYKPPATAATEAAKRTLLGQVYLDWGTWAVVRDVGPGTCCRDGAAATGAEAERGRRLSLRICALPTLFWARGRSSGRSPLSGWVYIVDGRDDAGEAMSGREQR